MHLQGMETISPHPVVSQPPKPLSFRQREFARHYASGLSLQQAAQKAGYSASTIETNGNRLLSSKRIAALIERFRSAKMMVSAGTMRLCIDKLETILQAEDDPDQIIKIARILTTLYKAQSREGASLADEDSNVNQVVRPEATSKYIPDRSDKSPDRNPAQLPEDEQDLNSTFFLDEDELLELERNEKNRLLLDERRRQRNALGKAKPKQPPKRGNRR